MRSTYGLSALLDRPDRGRWTAAADPSISTIDAERGVASRPGLRLWGLSRHNRDIAKKKRNEPTDDIRQALNLAVAVC
jgi:hypothetical protein